MFPSKLSKCVINNLSCYILFGRYFNCLHNEYISKLSAALSCVYFNSTPDKATFQLDILLITNFLKDIEDYEYIETGYKLM